MARSKQERFDELVEQHADGQGEWAESEITERVQLYWELHADENPLLQHLLAGRTPRQVWGIDTSDYTREKD